MKYIIADRDMWYFNPLAGGKMTTEAFASAGLRYFLAKS